MKEFFYAIQDFFVNFAFWPFDKLRAIQLDNWWTANIVSWILLIIGVTAFVYWMLQLKSFNESTEEIKA